MAACPNCGRNTLRTKDWACQWCGYPLISRAYKVINKTFKELQDERNIPVRSSGPEDEPELEPEDEVEDDSAPEPQQKPPERPAFRHRVSEPTPPPEPPRESMRRSIQPPPPPRYEPQAPPVKPVQPAMTPGHELQPPPPRPVPPAVIPPRYEPPAPPKDKAAQPPGVIITPPPPPRYEPPIQPVTQPRYEPQPPPATAAPMTLDAVRDGMEINADELDELFRTEKTGINAKLTGKTLVIRGIVEKVFVREHLDIRYIVLTGSQKKMVWSIRCTFNKDESIKVTRLKEGQEVLVRSKYDGYGKNIIFKDCALL